MSKHIILSVESRIRPGMLMQLEEALQELLQHIQDTEDGALFYAWYVDKPRERCHVIQHYVDGDALLFHLQNYKAFAAKLNALRKVDRVVCCGTLPACLVEGFHDAGVEMFELAGKTVYSDLPFVM